MTVDRDTGRGTVDGFSGRARAWLSVIVVALVLWCLFAWLVLDRPFLDAAGESVGTALATAVVASLVGALRRSGRGPADG